MHQNEINEQIQRERKDLVEQARAASSLGWRGESPTRVMQRDIRAHAWPYTPDRMFTAIAACLGQTFSTDDDPEAAVEALGMAMVHAAALLDLLELSIAPVIGLARVFSASVGEQPVHGVGKLALAVLDAPRRPRLEVQAATVYGMALTIAKAIDDCEVLHELRIDPHELFIAIAAEVLAGRQPVIANMSGVVTAPIAPGPLALEMSDGEVSHVHPVAEPSPDEDNRVIHAPPNEPRLVRAAEQLRVAAGVASDESAGQASSHADTRQLLGLEPAKRFDLSEEIAAEVDAAHAHMNAKQAALDAHGYGGPPTSVGEARPVVGLAESCPQCAAPMSLSATTLLFRCTTGHEHSEQDLLAITEQKRRAAASAMTETQPISRMARLKPVPPRSK